MNLNHLAVFHAVAQAGSVNRGAERLHISQPAVSKQLRQLERSLNAKLFDRLPHGMRLTATGEVLATYARRLFALEAEAERAVAELHDLERGHLTIGASMTIGVYLLPAILARFRQQHPGVELQVEIANTEIIQQKLIDNLLDIGFTEGFVEAAELEVTVFLQDRIVAIAPPQHPLLKRRHITAERLCREPLILREVGSGTRAVVERALAAKGLTMQPVMSLGSTEAIKRAVAAGVGVALVSQLAISQELQHGQLKLLPVQDLEILRSLHRVRLRGKHESRAVRAFQQQVEAYLQSGADTAA